VTVADKGSGGDRRFAMTQAPRPTPHVVQNDSITATGKRRQSAIDGRTTRHKGYSLSQSCRAMIECIFGWGKQHGTMRKTKHRGITKVTTDFMLNLIAYNLIRIPKLLTA
jgi:Transposase DDE domain